MTIPVDPFGDDFRPTVRMDDIVAFIKETKPSALTPDAYADVISILEYMRDTQLRMNDALNAREQTLNNRDVQLTQKEKELNMRKRAVDLILKGQTEPVPAPKKSLWR